MKVTFFIVILTLINLLQGCQENFIKSSPQNSPVPQTESENSQQVRGIDYPSFSENNEKRYALLIGNATYNSGNLSNLVSPINDIDDMKKILESSGMWEVETLLNAPSKRKIKEKVEQFTSKHQGKTLLFFYTGHATQLGGESYLLTVGHDFNAPADVEDEALRANYILGKFNDAQSKLSIIILDACRDNTLEVTKGSGNKGIAPLQFPSSVRDYYLAYATRPGEVAIDKCGRNSCYTKHFLKAIEKYGRKPIEEVFRETTIMVSKETGKQVPEYTPSIPSGEKFCIFGCEQEPEQPGEDEEKTGKEKNTPKISCKDVIAKTIEHGFLNVEERQIFDSCGNN